MHIEQTDFLIFIWKLKSLSVFLIKYIDKRSSIFIKILKKFANNDEHGDRGSLYPENMWIMTKKNKSNNTIYTKNNIL